MFVLHFLALAIALVHVNALPLESATSATETAAAAEDTSVDNWRPYRFHHHRPSFRHHGWYKRDNELSDAEEHYRHGHGHRGDCSPYYAREVDAVEGGRHHHRYGHCIGDGASSTIIQVSRDVVARSPQYGTSQGGKGANGANSNVQADNADDDPTEDGSDTLLQGGSARTEPTNGFIGGLTGY